MVGHLMTVAWDGYVIAVLAPHENWQRMLETVASAASARVPEENTSVAYIIKVEFRAGSGRW